MTNQQIEQARIYAEAEALLAEHGIRGSAQDTQLVLAAIVELQSIRAIPQALPDAQRT